MLQTVPTTLGMQPDRPGLAEITGALTFCETAVHHVTPLGTPAILWLVL